jgi:hypothetical protein
MVAISDAAGCSTPETIVVNSQLGIVNHGEQEITVYPNSMASFITILAGGPNFRRGLLRLRLTEGVPLAYHCDKMPVPPLLLLH